MIVSKLDPAQAVSFWDSFQPGVEEIYALSHGEFGWAPNDVFRALKEREAVACFVYEGEERVGWFIYHYLIEAASRKPFCHIWLAWAKPEHRGRLQDMIMFGLNWLGKETKKHHCQYIEMDSNRVGWMKMGPKIGLKPHRIVFRAEV